MKTQYIIICIGCIECGVSSKVAAVLENKDDAIKLSEILLKEFEWRDGGQNSFEVFEIPKLNFIDNEFLEYSQKHLNEKGESLRPPPKTETK